MTIPMELQHASEDFERFLADVKNESGLATRNQTYTMVQGVFRAFRRRLDFRDALRFANTLPPILRAIFIDDWDTEEVRLPFSDRETITQEVQSFRKNHNFSPETSIHDVAIALWKHVDKSSFVRILETLPKGAADFWKA